MGRAAGECPETVGPLHETRRQIPDALPPLLSTVHCSWGHKSYPGPMPCGDWAQALKAIGLQMRSCQAVLPRPWGLRWDPGRVWGCFPATVKL